MKYWLMKSEPESYSLDQLKKDKTTWWEGVRNYQARNYMTQSMNRGDQVLFYHSNATPSGIVGLAEVCAQAKPDESQFNKKSDYYDTKATLAKPNWFCVQVKYLSHFKNFISLDELKKDPNCENLIVIKKGQRLSIQPVDEKDFHYLVKKGN